MPVISLEPQLPNEPDIGVEEPGWTKLWLTISCELVSAIDGQLRFFKEEFELTELDGGSSDLGSGCIIVAESIEFLIRSRADEEFVCCDRFVEIPV